MIFEPERSNPQIEYLTVWPDDSLKIAQIYHSIAQKFE